SGNPGTKLAFNSFVIFIAADQTLTLDGAGDFVFNALVQATSGSCNLVKNGTGTANVGGDGRLGSIGGRVVTTLNDGTLLVTGTTGITTVTGGTLASQVIGSVGTITATGGTIAPGGLTAPGILTSGATTFNSATTFDVQLNGTSPGGMGIVQPIPSEYDHLDVTGPVELGGSTLQLQVNFTPAETDQFTIINNLDGVSQLTNMPVHYPTTGTFKGLPEGAIFSVNGVPFKITYRGGDGNDVVLTGVPKLSINDVSITEGNSGSANATFTVSLSTPRTEAITVDFGTADGTATAGSDYGPRSGTRVFNPGQTSETITIPILGDTIGEADETFFVILTDPVGAVLNRAVGKGTIVNDDGPPTPSQLSINDVTTTEGDSGTTSAVFTVTLSPASSQAVAVDYFTSDNTATAGSDYQFVSSTLVFNPGTTTRTITVPIKGDTVPEATETFFVNLTNASNAGIAKAQGTGTINDNDVPTSSQLSINDITTTEGDSGTTSAVFTVTLSPASNQTVSVDYFTSDNTATAGADYQFVSGTATFNPGTTTRTVTVPIKGDTIAESTETFFVNLTNANNASIAKAQGTGTITDNDSPTQSQLSIDDITTTEGDSGTTNAVFTVTLTPSSNQTVSVDYFTPDVTATAGTDYQFVSGTLTFNPGTTTRSVTIPIKGDTVLEPTETFFVNLSNANNAGISKAQGAGTINDNDAAGVFQFSSATLVAPESSGSATLTITRTGDTSGAASINFETSDNTAQQKNDYTFGSGTVRFGPGETSKSISVLLINDVYAEGNETLQVSLSNPSGSFIVGNPGTAIVTIVDDDAVTGAVNPIDAAQFFVRQHYLDFLGREPDSAGLAFWTNNITSCGADANCILNKRIDTSAAFFLSIEFQETGGNVFRSQRVAFGRQSADPATRVSYLQFMRDTRQVGQGVIVGQQGYDLALEQNKQAYAQQIVTSAAFVARFPNMSAADFVDALFASAAVLPTAAERNAAINAFDGGGAAGRVAALRSVVDSASVRQAELRSSFVLAEYYGYLRRNPTDAPDFSDAGYQFWLNKLNQFAGDFHAAEMVKAFISAQEYRQRFGPF
ncbi:MAG TPA: Calx-beta domain-containing protein, partial [Pyrinomonadaceae bacterium]|nr:Calx-beta domain-containing protein [Pyrinomonadaceae bacterium]